MRDELQGSLPNTPPTMTSSLGTAEDAVGRASIAIALLIAGIVVFWPFLGTHYVTQDDSRSALLSWREMSRSAFDSARVSGRFFALFSFGFGWLPHAIDNFIYFKTVQMVGLLGNFVALYYLARKVARSHYFALFALVVALVTMQARWEHNLVTAYPWAFSTSLTFAMVAIGLFVDYLDGGSKRKQMLSGVCFSLSLLTYESFLLYGAVFAVVAWPRRQGITRGLAATARSIWPHAALGSLYLAAYLGFRIVFPTQYGGNQMSFSPSSMFAVWSTFGRSALPTSAYADLSGLFNVFSVNHAGFVSGPFAVFKQIRVEWVILAIVVALLCCLLLPRAASETQGQGIGRAAVVGLLMAGVPQIPHAFSPQYQAWVRLGVKSHVPTYFAAFGVTLLLACALTAVARVVRDGRPWTWCVAAGLTYIALLTAFSNFYVARSQTIARHKWDLVDAVLRSEQFAKLPENAVVLAPSWWHGVNIMQVLDDYWTQYARKKTGRRVHIVRTFAEFRAICGTDCEGRAFFAKYAREGQDANQYVLFAPIEGGPVDGLSATFVDVFVLSGNRWFSVFASVRGGTRSTVMVDGLPVTDSAEGSVWIPLDRRGEHKSPITFRISSRPGHLDPDSVILSNYVDADRFVGTVQPIFGKGFYSEESSGNARWNWAEEQATLILRNESSLPRDVTVSFNLSGTSPSCHIAVDQTRPTLALSDAWSAEHSLHARIGPWQDREIRFSSDCPRAAGDPRNLRFNLRLLHISERVALGRQP